MALEISLCDLWMENQISYSAQTWHTSGKEKDWSDFKFCLFFRPIWTWYERLLLHSAGRENKWIVQESNFQHINGKLKKECIKTGGFMSRTSIPFIPHLALDSLWLKALHWSEWQVENEGDA